MGDVVVIGLRVRAAVLHDLVQVGAPIWIVPESFEVPAAAGSPEVIRYSAAPDMRFQIPELAAAYRAAEAIAKLGSRAGAIHGPRAEGVLYLAMEGGRERNFVLHGEGTRFGDFWIDRARAILLSMEKRTAAPGNEERGVVASGITVSAVVPVYNLHQYLDETLQSVFHQTRKVDEILVVDDGSENPQTVGVLKDLEKNEARVRVLWKPHSGLAATRNYGIAHAKSTHILTLDADDCIREEFVERAVEQFRMRSDLVMATSMVSCFTESVDEPTGGWCPLGFDRDASTVYNFASCATAIMPREVLNEVGRYDESFPAYEDWELYCRLMRRGEAAVVPEFLIDVRIRGDSMLRTLPRIMHETLRARIMERHGDLAKNPGLAMRLLQGEYVDFYGGTMVDPSEQARELVQSQLRYRLADKVNEGLKKLGVQKVIKKAGEEWSERL